MPRFVGELGEDVAGTQRRGGTHNGRTHQGPIETWAQAEGGKGGGGKPAQERQQTQARGTGRRYERRRLEDGGKYGRRPGGRRFAPGEEMGSG